MQTRIKVKETVGGDKTYYIQKRRDFYHWPLYLIPIYGWLSFPIDLIFWDDVWGGWDNDSNVYSSEYQAKASIDKFLDERERLLIREKENKIKKTTYIKYP